MKINDYLFRESEWLKGTGPKSNIVISSRVRLARNIDGNPFFNRASEDERKSIMDKCMSTLKKEKYFKGSIFIEIDKINDVERLFFVERHLMSPEHMSNPDSKGLVVDDKEIVSIMVNEEDHLRIQVLQSGFNLMEAWRIVDNIDSDLSLKTQFAFSNRLGYLTACPTNIGTGLRGSVMLHLPALTMTKQINKIFQAISKLGLTMRGFYGEGTEAIGDFFQISNQVTLGHSETELLTNIERIINKIVLRESATRAMLISKRKDEITDKVWRALGTLKSARIISSNETIRLLSTIRLGVDLGIIKNLGLKVINELFILIQPAHLQLINKSALTPQERDSKRAALLREKLGQ